MTNVIPMFAFNDSQLRCTIIDAQPWFVAADACRILGMKVGGTHGGTHRHLTNLDADEKQTVRRSEAELMPLFEGTPAPSLVVVSRPGLFKLIGRSSKPEAKQFDRWVRHEVLPPGKSGGWCGLSVVFA